MANEYRNRPVERIAPLTDFAHGRGGHDLSRHDLSQGRESARASSQAYGRMADHSGGDHPVADVASVLGLPADAVSPEVLAAVTPLLAEMDRLRFEHRQAEHLLAGLRHLADHDPVVQCLNRRGFMHEVETYLRGGGGGTLAVLFLGQLEALGLVHGLAASEGALRHACGCALQVLRGSDRIGYLGGGDFGVLLPDCGRADACAKLAEIGRRLNDPGFRWMGQVAPLVPLCGFHHLAPGDDSERALAAADRDRRGLGGLYPEA